MRQKFKSAMTVIIAIQSLIEIGKFVGENYKTYKIRKLAKSVEEDYAKNNENITNDEV